MVSVVRKASYIHSIVFLIAIATVALTLHLAQGFTGQLQLQQPAQESTAANFAVGTAPYPRHATDQDGRQFTFLHAARRVASQYWSIDEMLYSILPPQSVAGVSEYAYDLDISNVYQLAEAYRPAITANPEAVLAAAPDLLLVSSTARADLTDLLRNAGVPSFRMFTNYSTLDEIASNILLMGYLTGHDSAARRVHEEFQRAIQRAATRKPGGVASPRVLGYSGRYSYGSQTLFHDVLRLLGATNVAAEQGLLGYEAVNTEQIVRWNPEWIVSSAKPGETNIALRRLLEDPAIALTTAARKGQILVLANNVFLPMSPFTVTLLDILSEAFYGNRARS
jgi:iron complex transport system substrate-binding protein